MKNTKNTFDLSLDIPLYGDINKLNFCNEYELNHYCFWEGSEGGDDPSGGPGGEDSDDDAAEDAASAAESMGDTEFEISRAASLADMGISSTTDNPFSFIMTDVRDPENVMELATRSAVPGDPEFDEEEDLGFNIGTVPGTGGEGGLLGLFTTPPAKTSMEQVATQMGMPSYQQEVTELFETGFPAETDWAAYDAAVAKGLDVTEEDFQVDAMPGYDPGATHEGLGILGLNTGLGRGYAADLVGQPEPGSFSLTGLATALANYAVPGLGSLIGYATNQGTNMGAYGNIAESVFGFDANQTMADVEAGLSSLGQGLGLGSISTPDTITDDVSFDVEDFYDDDVYGSPDIRYNRNPYVRNPYVRKPYVRNPNIRYRNPNIRYADEGGLVSLANGGNIRDVVEDQTTLIDVINTGQAMPPNIGATQAQGSMQPMQANQSNQQNVYTQSAQPQSFYAQPQQVKNHGNLY